MGGAIVQADRLPDLLIPRLRVIFVGTAAGKRSAEKRQYYAGRGNRFWRTLHDVGLTPCRLDPSESRQLLGLSIGLTDMSKLGAGMDHEIASHEFDPGRFMASVRYFRPAAVAFNGKKAASIWLGRKATKSIVYGRQAPVEDFPVVYVLPSTSGAANAHWDVEPWMQLAIELKRSSN
jgi:TDG/mug DNA glycosylase family protein